MPVTPGRWFSEHTASAGTSPQPDLPSCLASLPLGEPPPTSKACSYPTWFGQTRLKLVPARSYLSYWSLVVLCAGMGGKGRALYSPVTWPGPVRHSRPRNAGIKLTNAPQYKSRPQKSWRRTTLGGLDEVANGGSAMLVRSTITRTTTNFIFTLCHC